MGIFDKLFSKKKVTDTVKENTDNDIKGKMMLTLFDLFEICNMDELAAKSSGFQELIGIIQNALDHYCTINGIKDSGIQYITINPNSISYAEPEVILWVYLLFNPAHKLGNCLDDRRKMLLSSALQLNPDDYSFGNGYHYDHVAEKLNCSRMEGIYITEFWKILPVYSDLRKKEINLSYLLQKASNAERAAKLYSVYASCSVKKAEEIVQEYLAKDAGQLFLMYPGGKLDIVKNELVMRMSFTGENGKSTWLNIEHPFFLAHSPEPKHSAEMFFDFMSHSIYRYILNSAFGYQDHHIEYGYGTEIGHEAQDRFSFSKMEQYSYHDGGGGYRETWCMLALSRNKEKRLKEPKEIMTGDYYSKRNISMPPCDSYWEVDGVLYIKNPFDMKHIFVLETTEESWD